MKTNEKGKVNNFLTATSEGYEHCGVQFSAVLSLYQSVIVDDPPANI